MCRKRTEPRRVDGQGNDKRKQASVCLEIRANTWEQYGKFSSAGIMDDSFGHIERFEMSIVMIASGEFLDDVGVFLDHWRNGRVREVNVFVVVFRSICKREMEVVVIATGNECARRTRRPGGYTGNDIVNDRTPILFSEQRGTRPQAFFDSNCMNGHELELSYLQSATIAVASPLAIEMWRLAGSQSESEMGAKRQPRERCGGRGCGRQRCARRP